MRIALIAGFAILAVAVACAVRIPATAPGAAEAAVTTDRDAYALERADGMWRTRIGFALHNRGDQTLSLLNCRGAFGLELQKREAGEWVAAWQPALPMCLSPAIEIPPGGAHETTLEVVAGERGSNVIPQFHVDELAGTYRLVITSAYLDYDSAGPPWGREPPLELRVSDPFELTVAGG